jgi:hypothetical protein
MPREVEPLAAILRDVLKMHADLAAQVSQLRRRVATLEAREQAREDRAGAPIREAARG